MLLRFPSATRSRLPELIVNIVAEQAEKLGGRFVVVQPGRIRFSI
jgi:hypothetical protein